MRTKITEDDCICDCACHVDPVWHYNACCHKCVMCGKLIKVGYETPHKKFCPGYIELKKEKAKKKRKRKK